MEGESISRGNLVNYNSNLVGSGEKVHHMIHHDGGHYNKLILRRAMLDTNLPRPAAQTIDIVDLDSAATEATPAYGRGSFVVWEADGFLRFFVNIVTLQTG